MSRTKIGLWIAIWSASARLALGQQLPDFPTDVRVEAAVDYLPGDRAEKADLYFPAEQSSGLCPAVIQIHGGGFSGGRRDAGRELNICAELARHGYVAMSIDYALCATGKASWPQNLTDCKLAVRWLRTHAKELGVDPARIGVMGGSAGALLALMVALSGPEDGLDPSGPDAQVSCRVQCCIDLYGPSDLTHNSFLTMFGLTRAEAPELYRRASPVNYATADDPPVLMLHGTFDTIIEPEQSQLLAIALDRAGVVHELKLVEGAGHGFDLQAGREDLRPVFFEFLERNLRGRK